MRLAAASPRAVALTTLAARGRGEQGPVHLTQGTVSSEAEAVRKRRLGAVRGVLRVPGSQATVRAAGQTVRVQGAAALVPRVRRGLGRKAAAVAALVAGAAVRLLPVRRGHGRKAAAVAALVAGAAVRLLPVRRGHGRKAAAVAALVAGAAVPLLPVSRGKGGPVVVLAAQAGRWPREYHRRCAPTAGRCRPPAWRQRWYPAWQFRKWPCGAGGGGGREAGAGWPFR